MKPCSPLWPGRLRALVDAGASAILVDQDMKVAAAGDRVIDIGPGAGDDRAHRGERPAAKVAASRVSRTTPCLALALDRGAVATTG